MNFVKYDPETRRVLAEKVMTTLLTNERYVDGLIAGAMNGGEKVAVALADTSYYIAQAMMDRDKKNLEAKP